jgi:hypothetical protein
MEVTHKVFLEADNLTDIRETAIRKISVLPAYGLLPESEFQFNCSLNNQALTIHQLTCQAITPSGYVIDFEDNIDISVYLNNLSESNYFLVIKSTPSDLQEVKSKEILLLDSNYSFGFKWEYELENDELPIAQIDRIEGKWVKKELFIPPVIAFCSHPILKGLLEQIQSEGHQMLVKLLEKVEPAKNSASIFDLKLLLLELKNITLSDTPKQLILLLKKLFLFIFTHFPEYEKPAYTEFVVAVTSPYKVLEDLNMLITILSDILTQWVALPAPPVPEPPKEPVRRTPNFIKI